MDVTKRKLYRTATCLGAIVLLCLPGPALAGSKHGIDVSHHQGRIRWTRVAKAGVDFTFIKATEGVGVRDPRYAENRKRAKGSKIKVGAYHFARPSGAKKKRVRDDARLEARYFLNVARPQKNELAPVLDLETSGDLNRAQLRRWTAAWLKHVHRKTGARAIVYASPVFWQDRMSGTQQFASKHPLWVAHYTRVRPDVPARAWAGEGWTFWQWTDCGRVRGIKGCVDRNRFAADSLRDLLLDPDNGNTTKKTKKTVKKSTGRLARRSSDKDRPNPKAERRTSTKQRPEKTRPHEKAAQRRPRPKANRRHHRKNGQIRSGSKKNPASAEPRVAPQSPVPARGPRRPLAGPQQRRWTRWV